MKSRRFRTQLPSPRFSKWRKKKAKNFGVSSAASSMKIEWYAPITSFLWSHLHCHWVVLIVLLSSSSNSIIQKQNNLPPAEVRHFVFWYQACAVRLLSKNYSDFDFCQKLFSTHEGMCRCDMFLGHVPATVTCVCTHFVFAAATCPRYTSLLHVPALWTTHDFFAAICCCDRSPESSPVVFSVSPVSRETGSNWKRRESSPLGLPAPLTLILIGETERRLETSHVPASCPHARGNLNCEWIVDSSQKQLVSFGVFR